MFGNNMSSYSQEFLQCVGFIFYKDKLKKEINIQNFANQNCAKEFKKHNHYLISKEWIGKWKQYIGYEEIKNKMKQMQKPTLESSDYQWVQTIINNNTKDKALAPLVNRDIYETLFQNMSAVTINQMKDFIVLDEQTFMSFINKNDPLENELSKHPPVKIKVGNNKIIIKFDESNYLIYFKYSDMNMGTLYCELIFTLDQNNFRFLSMILNDIYYCDMEKWVNQNGGINCLSYHYQTPNFTLEIKNKTVIRLKSYNTENTIRPNLYPNEMNKVKDFQNTLKTDPNLATQALQIFDFFSTTAKARAIQMNPNINQTNSFFPHPIGLQNIGQTCYMNATLECLSNIEELTVYILNYNFLAANPLSKPLSLFYWDLLRNLFFPNEEVKKVKYFAPHFFKQIIGKNPLFQGFHAADSKDLLFYILETIHDELNMPNNNINNNINYNNVNMGDKNQVFALFMNDFISNNNSIISNLFYGFFETSLQCLTCRNIKYSFQSFNIEIIPLIKAHQYKLQKYHNNSKPLNINDALESLAQNEKFVGDNMIYCNDCKGLTEAIHQQKIFRTPRYLIIVLNRGKGNKDYQGEFEFSSQLDLTNLVTDPSSPKQYFLTGVISHIGESGSSGHFIAFCRNQPRSFFHCYNDAAVFQLSKNDDAYGKNQPNDINTRKLPYILFYKALDNNNYK